MVLLKNLNRHRLTSAAPTEKGADFLLNLVAETYFGIFKFNQKNFNDFSQVVRDWYLLNLA